MHLQTAGLLVIENRKLLLAFSNNKQCFYLPGGKLDEGETSRQALCREVKEELAITLSENDLYYYTHITAPAYGEPNGIMMEQDCFIVHEPVTPAVAAEIGALRFFSLEEYLCEPVHAPGAVMILEKLKADKLVD